MKCYNIIIAILFASSALAATGVLASDHVWVSYHNARYGYSIDYPKDSLRALREADDGDGRAFEALQGSLRASVWASYDEDQKLESLADEAQKGCANPKSAYRVSRPSKTPPFVVVSCNMKDGRIVYTKAMKCDDVVTQILIYYKNDEAKVWQSAVSRMSTSLTAGCGSQ